MSHNASTTPAARPRQIPYEPQVIELQGRNKSLVNDPSGNKLMVRAALTVRVMVMVMM